MYNHRTFIQVALGLSLVFFSMYSLAAKDGVTYTSTIDSALTIHKISYLPTTDNVDGILARPFDVKLKELLQADHQWEYVDSQFIGSIISPYELMKTQSKVTKIGKPIGADALLIAEVRKNPKDIVVSLNLFSVQDGKLITQLVTSDLPQSSTDKALAHLELLYSQLKFKIPYDGLILSRTKNRVTMNLGQIDNILPGQVLNCSKIVEVQRHPKLGYIMQNEKALLGTIKVLKVDKALAFGDIVSESEPGAIQKDSKITGARMVNYKAEDWIKKDYLPPEMVLSENNQIVGGTEEWKPQDPPTFGQVSAGILLGPQQYSLSLQDGTTYTSKTSFYPAINIAGQIWINPEWYLDVGIQQGTASSKNPVAGGSPGDLTTSYGQYTFDLGYNLLLKDDFWDSKLFFALGIYNFRLSVDNSNPVGLTSLEYKSLRLTLGGKTPVDDANRFYAGAMLYWYLNPSMNEDPVSSGSEKSRIVHFNFSGDYRYSERVWINSGIDFKTLTTNFSGTGTRPGSPGQKATNRFTQLNLGITYMF
ncbi:MAG: porin family protein [Bdellovibrionales bacterium]|nr:porin family protein [Bdellovibrionales bacterium]